MFTTISATLQEPLKAFILQSARDRVYPRAFFFLLKVEQLQSHLSKKNSGDYLFKHKNHFKQQVI